MPQIPFDDYLRRFDYDERLAMKTGLDELLEDYAKGEIQLIDIRFREEYAAWSVGLGILLAKTDIEIGRAHV